MKSTSVLLASAMVFVLAVASAPLFAQGAWKPLFNGKDFTGWTIQAYGQRGAGRSNRAEHGATPGRVLHGAASGATRNHGNLHTTTP